tara:strand:- start:154 stop:522 length:369 start_codon:yes stop_codon:yes gene_type:complete
MPKEGTSRIRRIARHQRVRKNVNGSSERPRMSVYRSLNHTYAQVIDDKEGVTLVSASSLEMSVKNNLTDKSKKEIASLVGSLIAERAMDNGLKEVIFDRGGYKYHGRVKAVAEAARKGGLTF